MMNLYKVSNRTILSYNDYEHTYIAVCDEPHKALGMLLKAWALNDKRKYTASARLIAQAEQLPGFQWINEVKEGTLTHV